MTTATARQRQPGGLGPRVLRGIELGVAGNVLSLAAAFFITPFLARRLGAEGYALFALIGTLQGYLTLLNFGTGTGVQRYAGHYKRDPARLSGALKAALVFELAAGLVGCALLLAGRRWLASSFFKIQGQPLATVAAVLAWAAATGPLTFALNFAQNALYGLERFAAYNALLSLQSILVLAAAAAVIAAGHGILAVAAAVWAVYAALAAGALLLVLPVMRSAGTLHDKERREFFAFSGKSFASQLLWQCTSQGDRLFIGSSLPLTQLGFYSICGSLAQKLNVFLGAVAQAAFPIMTDLQASGEEARLRRFYLKATELALLVILPVSILSFVFTPQFMGLWISEGFAKAAVWPFRLLVVANVAYISSFLPQFVALSRGAPGLHARVYAAKLVVLVAAWSFLIPRLGIKGAALGILIAEWLITPAYLAVVHRRFLGISAVDFWDEACWRPLAASGALLALVLPTHHLFDGWLSLFGACGVSFALYLAFAYWLLDQPAKDVLREWLRGKLCLVHR